MVVQELTGRDPLLLSVEQRGVDQGGAEQGGAEQGGADQCGKCHKASGSVCSCGWWTEPRRRAVTTTILFSLTLALAIAVPTIGSVITLLGGTGALFIFVFPGMYMYL